MIFNAAKELGQLSKLKVKGKEASAQARDCLHRVCIQGRGYRTTRLSYSVDACGTGNCLYLEICLDYQWLLMGHGKLASETSLKRPRVASLLMHRCTCCAQVWCLSA